MTLESEKLLDEIGWKIVRELQENARLSYAELGRRVGLSIPAVTERVRKLEDAGIITGYHAEINPEKIGRPITAFIRMNIMGDAPRLTAMLKEMPEIVECHRGTGGDSFILKASVASVHHLEKLIDGLLPFGMTTTSIVLSSPVVKRFIEPPARENDYKKSPGRAGRK
ncbi:MAG TPA: Lrp/AsnC family transcriptional regulator [Blastocatellia bacterium]|nr:Lrp/AsnC family transcriptional regulator [Blastocatellia bacterium]